MAGLFELSRTGGLRVEVLLFLLVIMLATVVAIVAMERAGE